METVSYTSTKGDIYRIEPIIDTLFIDEDMLSVIDIVSDTDLVQYKSAMEDSIKQKLAYSVYENGARVGFVYNRVFKGKYYGASIYIKGVIPVIVALRSMFEIADFKSISFIPHKNNLKYFKSMIEGHNIRAYHSGIPTITIKKERMWNNGVKLFSYFGLEKI